MLNRRLIPGAVTAEQRDGINLHLEVLSREPTAHAFPTPILFVHGAWHAAWCWDEYFLPYFASQGYSAHAVSLRGHGQSEGGEWLRLTSINDYVQDVRRVAGQLPRQLPRPPVLVGHSMGCWVVQKYLEQHPATAAVLLAPMPPMGPWPFVLDMARQYPLRFLRPLMRARLAIPGADIAHKALFTPEMPHSQVKEYFERLQEESPLAMLEILFGKLGPRKDMAIPLLVLGAMDDTVFSLPEVQDTARLQHTQAEAFPHMGHDMMLERNWQRVADRVIGWLQDREI